MHVVGRYERLRGYETWRDTYTAPVIYDKGRAQGTPRFLPVKGEEWWQSPSGLWVEVRKLLAQERGSFSSGYAMANFNGPFGACEVATVSALPEALSSAYTAGSAGAAVGAKIAIPETKTLNVVYFYVDSITGTRANVNDLNWELRPDSSGSPNTGSLTASASVDPSGFASGWHRFASLSQSLTGVTWYWSIIADADGNATDFANLRSIGANGGGLFANGCAYATSQAYKTTNGWSTKTARTGGIHCVFVFSDGTAFGFPWGTTQTPTSNTLQRGLLLNGVTEQLKIWGFGGSLVINGNATANIYIGSGGPTSGAVATGSLAILGPNAALSAVMLSSPYTLAKSTQYRLVCQGSTNSSIFVVGKVGTVNAGSSSDLMAAAPGGGGWYYTEEASGSPNTWGNDVSTAYPSMTWWLHDQVTVSGGGGGSGLGLSAVVL